MLINLRNALMASGAGLPYDAEVEFLESTGEQWIDTGIIGGSSSKVEISASSTNTAQNMGLFGSRNVSFVKAFTIWQRVTNTRVRFDFADDTANRVIANAAWDTSGVNTVIKDGPNNTLNGVAGANNATATFTCEYPFYLFSINTSGTATSNASARVYSCKIWQNGVLVRDFIPVRKGTVGYLYDRVSRRLFGNAGTGDFVLGPDVVPVEYIESHGTEWIDTGIKPSPSTSVETVFAMTTFTANCGLFGARGAAVADSKSYNLFIINNSGARVRWDWSGSGSYQTSQAETSTAATYILGAAGGNITRDGTTVTAVSSSKTAIDYPLYVFNMNNVGSPFATGANARFWSVKIYDGQTLGNNFLPVRVGTEGAMMDVLTRRVYRNQGTGAFTYGNDLKYPIPA